MRSLLFYTFIILLMSYEVKGQSIYNFENLTLGDVQGQDNWEVAVRESCAPIEAADITNEENSGDYTGSHALSMNVNGGCHIWVSRINDANWSLPDMSNAGTIVLQFDIDVNYWGNQVSLGFDANGDNYISSGETTFSLKTVNYDKKLVLQGPANTSLANYSYSDHLQWIRCRLIVDTHANNGAGRISLSFRDLTNSGPWQYPEGMQNVNAGFTSGSGTFTDPANINGILYDQEAGERGVTDNIKVWADPMILTYNTTLREGTTIAIPFSSGTVDVNVDWGDGNTNTYTSSGEKEHTYTSEGTYTVLVSGTLTNYGNGTSYLGNDMLTSVVSFGNIGITSLYAAFYGASNLSSVPDELPATVTSLKYLFHYATNFNGSGLISWDVSGVTDMHGMFRYAGAFDQDIGNWNMSAVTDMGSMFYEANVFNQDIGNWDVRSVTNMEDMFRQANAFNQDIGNWDVSAVTDMYGMFMYARAFDQDISTKVVNAGQPDVYTAWDVSAVTDMGYMFYEANAFNQDIGNWDVSAVTNMENMFRQANAFNQNIGNWYVSAVTDMYGMFMYARDFDQDISTKVVNSGQPDEYMAWDVSAVTDMGYMFYEANVFNQDIGNWDVNAVTNMKDMFYRANAFNQDIGNWDVSAVTSMQYMFYQANAFNQDIGNWDVSAVTIMKYMFSGAESFDQNISSWDVRSVTDMSWMFGKVGSNAAVTLSTANYDALLIGWNALPLQPEVFFDGGSSKYSSAALAARTNMTNPTASGGDNWTITDGGQATVFTWNGSESSNWETAGNWDMNAVPSANDDVIIANVETDPAINYYTRASCNSLTVNSGAALTINPQGSLITYGSITNNGTISVEQTLADDGHWHLIAMPNANTTANTFLDMYLQQWNEPAANWADIVDPATPLTPVKGYSLWMPTSKGSFTYTGTPNTGNQSLAITHSGSGWNLMGNPYPSFLDWDAVDGYGTKYTWNGTAYDQRSEAGAGDGSQYVGPTEGFFIYTAANATFSLSNAMRAHVFPDKSAEAAILQNGLVLTASNGNYNDNLWIVLDDRASPDFELERDAWKLLSPTEGLSQLYSHCPDGILSIDARPYQETIQLGFTNDAAGIYTIGVSEIADITTAVLEDTKVNLFHDLTKGAYEFAWDLNDVENRFKLHLNVVGLEETPGSESNILIYATNGNIFIKGTENGEVRVSELTGRIVLQQQINGEDIISIPANLKTGIYLVMVQQGKEIKTEKIFIK